MAEIVAILLLLWLAVFGGLGCELPDTVAPTGTGDTPSSGSSRSYSPFTVGARSLVETVRTLQVNMQGTAPVAVRWTGGSSVLPHPTLWDQLKVRSAHAAMETGRKAGYALWEETKPADWGSIERAYGSIWSDFHTTVKRARDPEVTYGSRAPLFAPEMLGTLVPDHLTDESARVQLWHGHGVEVPESIRTSEEDASRGGPTQDDWYGFSHLLGYWSQVARLRQYHYEPCHYAFGAEHSHDSTILRYPAHLVESYKDVDGYKVRPNVEGWVQHRDWTGRDREEGEWSAFRWALDPRMVQRYWFWREWWDQLGPRLDWIWTTEAGSLEEARQVANLLQVDMAQAVFAPVIDEVFDRFEQRLGSTVTGQNDIRLDLQGAVLRNWRWRTYIRRRPPPDPPGFWERFGSWLATPATWTQVAVSIYSGGLSAAWSGATLVQALGGGIRLAAQRMAMEVMGTMLSRVGLNVSALGVEFQLPGTLGHFAISDLGDASMLVGDAAMVIDRLGNWHYSGPTVPHVVIPPVRVV